MTTLANRVIIQQSRENIREVNKYMKSIKMINASASEPVSTFIGFFVNMCNEGIGILKEEIPCTSNEVLCFPMPEVRLQDNLHSQR